MAVQVRFLRKDYAALYAAARHCKMQGVASYVREFVLQGSSPASRKGGGR